MRAAVDLGRIETAGKALAAGDERAALALLAEHLRQAAAQVRHHADESITAWQQVRAGLRQLEADRLAAQTANHRQFRDAQDRLRQALGRLRRHREPRTTNTP